MDELREELLQVQLQLQMELHRRTGGGVESIGTLQGEGGGGIATHSLPKTT